MLRFLFRIVVVALVLAVGATAAAYYVLVRDGAGRPERSAKARVGAAAEALAESVDRERIREAGAELAETLGENVDGAGAMLADARLTAKIESKIALDDTLDGSRINIDTKNAEVTVRGTARTAAQRDRALQLARETAGVISVVDRVAVESR
jgi:osmotically-inducible protein OsmY